MMRAASTTASPTPPLLTPQTPSPGVGPAANRSASQNLSHDGGLQSRTDTASTSGAQAMPGRVSLPPPSAGGGIHNASIVRAVGSTLAAPFRPIMSTASNVLSAVAAPFHSAPSPLQHALQGDMNDPAHQLNAHAAAVDYGKQSAGFMNNVVPFVHCTTRLSVAGTSAAFGAGRNSGTAAADAAGRAEFHLPVHTGVYAPPANASLLSNQNALRMGMTGVQQLVLGSLTGGAGNLAGQYVLAPLVNKIPIQYQPIPEKAILPDQVVHDMNTLKPGSGTELLNQLKAMQKDVANISSDSNVRLGQIAFDSVTATRFAAMGATPLGMAGQVGFGLAVSATAGAVIGGVMAVRHAQAAIEIPNAAQLREAAAAHPGGNPAALTNIPKDSVPLFYSKHMTAPAQTEAAALTPTHQAEAAQNRNAVSRAVGAMAGAVQNVYHTIERPFVAGPLMDPLPTHQGPDGGQLPHPGSRVGQTISNVGASILNRAKLMGSATLMTTTMSTLSSMAASAMPGPLAQHAALAIGNAIGIHTAIEPWFNSLATHIPAGDNAIRANRQEQVNAQAAQAHVAVQHIDLEAGHVAA